MSKKLLFLSLFFIVFSLFGVVPSAFATKFDLIPPTGTLSRGDNITFTINIDTEGVAITSIQSGLTYDSTLLQYVSVTAGAAMNAVVADTTTYGTGKVLLTGTNNTGFNGTGVFATVVFTIIAQSSGSTEICSLWLPTPTGAPTTPPLPTSPAYATPVPLCGTVCTSNAQCPADMPCYIVDGQTSGVCRKAACPQIDSCVCPVPTGLPITGSDKSKDSAVVLAALFLALAGGIFYASQKQKYTFTRPTHKHGSKHEKSQKSS